MFFYLYSSASADSKQFCSKVQSMLENEPFHYYSLEFLRLVLHISVLSGFLAHLIHILKIFQLNSLNIFNA